MRALHVVRSILSGVLLAPLAVIATVLCAAFRPARRLRKEGSLVRGRQLFAVAGKKFELKSKRQACFNKAPESPPSDGTI